MLPNEARTIRRGLQTILAYLELGQPDQIKQAIFKLNRQLGQPREVALGGRHVFLLHNGFGLTLEVLEDQALFLEIGRKGHITGLALPCEVGRDMASLVLTYCDLSEAKLAS